MTLSGALRLGTAVLALSACSASAYCDDDVSAAGYDVGDAVTNLVKMSTMCWTDKDACVDGAQSMVDAIGAATDDIAQAVDDCGDQSDECTEAVQQIGDAIDSASDEAGNIADKCGYDQPAWSCVSASLSFSKTISANIASAIPGIVQSCQSYSGEKTKGKRAVDKSKIIRAKEQWRKAVEQKRQSAKKPALV